ncbi:hypothetical protein BDV12DRAFT_200682 [Aspergillus spectabilis]
MLLFLRRSRICYLLIITITGLLLLALPNTRNFPPPTTTPLTAIIAATSDDTFPSSLADLGLDPTTDSLVIYRADESTASFHPPVNKGREAISYLTYLIDHYDNLPPLMVFMHAHSRAWHQNVLLARSTRLTMRYLRREYVVNRGYANLLCEWRTTCPFHVSVEFNEEDEEHEIEDSQRSQKMDFGKAWVEIVVADISPPRFIASPMGGQFAITASQVRNYLTKDQLTWMRDWIVNTPLSSETAGSIFEYLWPYLFLGPSAESCPNEAGCYCQMYGICFNEGDGMSEVANKSLYAYYALIDYRDELVMRLLDAGEGGKEQVAGRDGGVRNKLHGIDDELNLHLQMAVERGLWLYPLDISDADPIDILEALPKYD